MAISIIRRLLWDVLDADVGDAGLVEGTLATLRYTQDGQEQEEPFWFFDADHCLGRAYDGYVPWPFDVQMIRHRYLGLGVPLAVVTSVERKCRIGSTWEYWLR